MGFHKELKQSISSPFFPLCFSAPMYERTLRYPFLGYNAKKLRLEVGVMK